MKNLERFVKTHKSQEKERICELANTLKQNNILIELSNTDTKEFAYKWKVVNEEADKSLLMLEKLIDSYQTLDRQFLALKEWIAYTDKFLTARIEQDVFAEDVPDDFAVCNLLLLLLFLT